MNLQKLFEAQAILDADIEKHHPIREGEDRLNKKILALLVELGECANEWRGFKFWSNDQHPRTVERIVTEWDDDGTPTEWNQYSNKNPLLEEYVDCLHFILSIGNDLKLVQNVILMKSFVAFNSVNSWTVTNHFNYAFRQVMEFAETVDQSKPDKFFLARALLAVLQLGHKLGFTWEQIEQAYFDKNKVNHQRQETGY